MGRFKVDCTLLRNKKDQVYNYYIIISQLTKSLQLSKHFWTQLATVVHSKERRSSITNKIDGIQPCERARCQARIFKKECLTLLDKLCPFGNEINLRDSKFEVTDCCRIRNMTFAVVGLTTEQGYTEIGH
jgi:hypothetical protein